jgi:hypothetical protein
MAAAPRLLDEAETRGGPNRDNLTLLAIDWEQSYGTAPEEDAGLAVETRTMPLDAHTTRIEHFGSARADEGELTDADIERAVAEIRRAINRFSR